MRIKALPPLNWLLTGALLVTAACSGDAAVDPCTLEDQDGIIGGKDVFILRVDDAGFSPIILKAQNRSHVTLTLQNNGAEDAGFVIDCLPTPNDDGCSQESCFPSAATIEPIPSGESETVEFETPEVEGEYVFRAAASDDRSGQFIID